MARSIYDIQGYAVVALLTPKYPSRHEADLQRELLIKAIRDG